MKDAYMPSVILVFLDPIGPRCLITTQENKNDESRIHTFDHDDQLFDAARELIVVQRPNKNKLRYNSHVKGYYIKIFHDVRKVY